MTVTSLGDRPTPGGASRLALRISAFVGAGGMLFFACTYPDFGFGPVDETGGGGEGAVSAGRGGDPMGRGGAGAVGQGGTPSVSSGHHIGGEAGQGGGGGDAPATVPCTEQSIECPEGQSCCFHESDPAQDTCAPQGTCGASFSEFSCNTTSDCPRGQICCATIRGVLEVFPVGVACETACNGADKLVMCDSGDDCSDGTCDPFAFSYPGYMWCE